MVWLLLTVTCWLGLATVLGLMVGGGIRLQSEQQEEPTGRRLPTLSLAEGVGPRT